MKQSMNNDTQFEVDKITEVSGDADKGWQITREGGWCFWVPKDSPVVPKVGMDAKFYGNGIGSTVRGLALNGVTVFYRTEAEESEHNEIQRYGKDATDWLDRWDQGKSVWSIEMGGLGPGYEQCIHITCAEILRELLKRKPDLEAMSADERRLLTDEIDKVLYADGLPTSKLGLSGAQHGAAMSLASMLYNKGPRGVMNDEAVKDRHIQVSKTFPQG